MYNMSFCQSCLSKCAEFKGIHLSRVPSSCRCSWCCWVRPAQSCIHNFLPTCSPRSHIFVLPQCGGRRGGLSGSCAAAQLQHSSVHPGCSLLHGYRHLCPAIGSESAEPARPLAERGEKQRSHWVGESVRPVRLVQLSGSGSLETRPV